MFHVNDTLYKTICILALIVCIVFEYFLFMILGPGQKIALVVYAILAVVYAVVMTKVRGGNQVKIELSYEEA